MQSSNLSSNKGNSSSTSQSSLSDITRSLDILAAVLDIVGIFGNIISFVVLLRCVRSASMYIILRCLAVGDTVFLVCHLFFQLAGYYRIIEVDRLTKGIGYTYIGNAAMTLTVWTTVLLSIERLVAVYYPFKHRYLFSVKRTITALLIVVLGSCLFRLPGFYQRLLTLQNRGNQSSSSSKSVNHNNTLTVTVSNNQDTLRFLKSLQFILWSAEAVASIAVVSVCNVTILVTIIKHIRQWSSVRSMYKQEMLATKLPLWVISMFLLSEMPKKICGLLMYLNKVTTYVELLVAICDVCTVLNCSTNIMVYFVCSKSFRSRIFMRLIASVTKKSENNCCGVLFAEYSAKSHMVTNARSNFCNESEIVSLAKCSRQDRVSMRVSAAEI